MIEPIRVKSITIGKVKTWKELEEVLKRIPEEGKQGPICCVDSGGSDIFPNLLKVGKFDDVYLYEGR